MPNNKKLKYSNSHIVIALVVLISTGCHSERRIAHKANKFLLNQRIDTVSCSVNELVMAGSIIAKCIDTFISVTEGLPQFDRRILPNLRITFGQATADSNVFMIYATADNIYLDPENIGLWVGDTILSSNPKYGILKYKGYKIFISVNRDSRNLDSEKAIFFKPFGKLTTMESYLFYSKKQKRYLDALPIWGYTLVFKHYHNQLIFVEALHTSKLHIR